MLKVLMVLHNLHVSNGVTSFAMNYFKSLDHAKVEMDFALYCDKESPHYATIQEYGGKIFVLPSIKKIKEHMDACRQILQDGNYDIVHDNTLHISIPMMWCAKEARIPVRILHSHNGRLGETLWKECRNKFFLPLLVSLATEYTACSQLAGNALFGEKNYVFIPNVISVEKYRYDKQKRRNIRTQYNVENKIVIGSVGRIAYQKNPFFAMNVFQKVTQLLPEAEYWWIGSGALDKQLKEYVKKLGLEDKVKFFGSRKDTPDLYHAMDVFFMPSLFEGLPLTCLEAQGAGLPVIVSDAVTKEMEYTDLIEFVSLNDSLEVWAKQLEQAAKMETNRPENRLKYADELKKSVFSDANCGNVLTGVYEKFLNDNKRL